MNNNLFILAIFWGVWIIIPVIFDGVFTFIYMIIILLKAPKPHKHNLLPETLPLVSIIIPTFNEEENINECLNYLKIQNYPQEKLEIIVVDNGSQDRTSEIVKDHMQKIWLLNNEPQNQSNQTRDGLEGKLMVNGNSYGASTFKGLLRLVIRSEKGKARALNTGIKLAKGQIIINIDCRAFLAPDAVYNMVAKFMEYPEYGAATGNIEIDWELIYSRDLSGHYVLDRNGHYIPRNLSRKEKFLGKSQFMEYLAAFRIGRQFQDVTGSMYTFSGAFSAFRREVLLNSSLYKSRTVSEDTDITLDLQRQHIRLGFAEDAKAFLKPVISFEKFYGQRVRWHRGEIEVIGLHLDWYANLRKGFWRGIWLGFLLMVDHTFGFPRIIWMFLLPMFTIFGYSINLIIQAIFLMYLLYVFIDLINAIFCYRLSDQETKAKIKITYYYCVVTPVFRLITFFFRFSAYLEVLKEPQSWSTPINPVRSVKNYGTNFRQNYQQTAHVGLKVWEFIIGKRTKVSGEVYYEEKIAEQDMFGLESEAQEGTLTPQLIMPKEEFTTENQDDIVNKEGTK